MLRLATHAMGTRFELVLDGGDEARLLAAGEEAIAVVQEWHARLNRFAKDSQLSFLNRTAHEQAVRIDEEVFGLLQLCRTVWEQSGGAFDPAVAQVVDALRSGAPAESGHAGMGGITLDEGSLTIRFASARTALDLGGIAKGFALDHAAKLLRECGVTSALVHGGTSSIVAIGAPPGRAGWTVRIDSAGEPARCTLCDAHLSVSSARGVTFGAALHARAHILDPRTGGSVAQDRTACVLASSGALAEAWSTALCVLGQRPAVLTADTTTAVHDPRDGWRVEGAGSSQFEIPGVPAALALEVS